MFLYWMTFDIYITCEKRERLRCLDTSVRSVRSASRMRNIPTNNDPATSSCTTISVLRNAWKKKSAKEAGERLNVCTTAFWSTWLKNTDSASSRVLIATAADSTKRSGRTRRTNQIIRTLRMIIFLMFVLI